VDGAKRAQDVTDLDADDQLFEAPPVSRGDRILATAWVAVIMFGLGCYIARDLVANDAAVTGCVIRFTPGGP